MDNRMKQSQKSVLSYLRDLTLLLAIVMVVFLLFTRIVVVSGPSMMSTLIDGDYLLVVGKPFYNTPKAGDIIVVSKDSFKNGEPIIKRVIATEGQTVEIRGNNLYVDGIYQDEDYAFTLTSAPIGDYYSTTVADGCIFVMGDNRAVSKDSRSNDIGQIDCREVLGKAVFVILPGVNEITNSRDFERFGVIS